MNTSKQVNVMLGLMFLVLVAFGLYFVWDESIRAENAAQKQVEKDAERGAFLFARNCRVCHGVTGRGALENVNLPGAPLNLADNRDPDKLVELQGRFRDTIHCGRVGTLMPPWSIAQGGPLNDHQIEQLVALITGATVNITPANSNTVSERAWEHALEFALHADTIGKSLTNGVSASDTVINVDSVSGLAVDTFLRIEDEVILIVKVPSLTELIEPALADDTALVVKDASGFQADMAIVVGEESMRVRSVSGDRLTVERGLDGAQVAYHKPQSLVTEDSSQIVVERGAFSTEAAEHAAGAEVFAGPILPPEGPLTGSDEFVCGQKAAGAAAPSGTAALTPSPGQPERPSTAQAVPGEFREPTNGVIETETKDNLFTLNNFKVGLGQQVTIRVSNAGQQPHNLRIAGLDGQWDSGDDFVTPKEGFLKGGESGELAFKLDTAATLVFRCDVHPTQMWGQVTVQ